MIEAAAGYEVTDDGRPPAGRLAPELHPDWPGAHHNFIRLVESARARQPLGLRCRGMYLETPSLLITDDDRDFRETLQSVFQPRGFRTLLAGDGEEALQIIQRETVHLVLLDMHMPRLTGLETIRRVRQFQSCLPCILISAGLDERLRQEAQQAQAFSVLAKPVRFSDVTETVRRALQTTYDWPAPS